MDWNLNWEWEEVVYFENFLFSVGRAKHNMKNIEETLPVFRSLDILKTWNKYMLSHRQESIK